MADPPAGEVLDLIASKRTCTNPMRLAPVNSDAPLPHLQELWFAGGSWEGKEIRRKLLSFNLLLNR